ncbi:MAG TPA: EF-hand domain-containing protein, partial [Phycisphaerae bacterium]|nr:EF-hand domain-containing protein [Phycisphaerae bacterium]
RGARRAPGAGAEEKKPGQDSPLERVLALKDENLEALFRKLDTDGDEKVSLEEFKKVRTAIEEIQKEKRQAGRGGRGGEKKGKEGGRKRVGGAEKN